MNYQLESKVKVKCLIKFGSFIEKIKSRELNLIVTNHKFQIVQIITKQILNFRKKPNNLIKKVCYKKDQLGSQDKILLQITVVAENKFKKVIQ